MSSAAGGGNRRGPTLVDNNADAGVTWHSYVTEDRRKTFCVYYGPKRSLIGQRERGSPGVYAVVISGHRESLPVQWIRRRH